MKKAALLLLLALPALRAQCPTGTLYPGSVDSNASLTIAKNNVVTTLSAQQASTDTVLVVASGAGWAANMMATVDTAAAIEMEYVTNVMGNVLTVSRACEIPYAGGTATAKAHPAGASVAHSATAYSGHTGVAGAVLAIENELGANLSNIPLSFAANSAQYIFSAYSCNSSAICSPGGSSGKSLSIGTNNLNFTPVPAGVNWNDTGHTLWVSGGTGTAEGCLISGGSGTGGSPSGTIQITCANTHSGAWTITSATQGAEEAMWAGNYAVFVPASLAADPGTLSEPAGYTVWDLRARAPVGYNTVSYNTIRQMGATPEVSNLDVLPPPYTQGLTDVFAVGTVIPSGSSLIEADSVLGTCDNYGGSWPTTQNGCVAFKAVSIAHAVNSPTWGANFVVGNQPSTDSPLVGLEVDLGNYVADTGSGARKNGLQVSMGGTAPAGDAVVINALNVSSGASWNYGILMEGSALASGGTGIKIAQQTDNTPEYGIDIAGPFSGSAINLDYYSGSGGNSIQFGTSGGTTGMIGVTSGTVLFAKVPSSGEFAVYNSSGTSEWQWGNTGLMASTGVAFASLPSASAGTVIWCTNCAVATPCTGSGSGAWAFSNSSRWACPF